MPISHFLLGVLVALLWAANFIAVRLGLDAGLPPMLLTALRFIAVATVAPFVLRPLEWRPLLGLGAALGLGQLGLSTLAVAAGLSPGIASLGLQTQAFFTMGLGVLLLRERPKLSSVLGALVAGVGIILLAMNRDTSVHSTPLLGIVLILSAALSWAIGNLLLRRFGQGAPPVAVAAWMAAVAALPLLGVSWTIEGSPLFLLSSLELPGVALGVVAYSAICSTLVATTAWAWLLSHHPAGRVAPLSLLVPVFGMSLSALLLGEHFASNDIIAATLILVGLIGSLWPKGWRLRTSSA